MEFRKHIFNRGLPKTGQTTEFVAGDDGTHEAGWWVKRINANNRTRFVAKTIGSDVIVFDRATGLCWAADADAAGGNSGTSVNFTAAIAYATGLTFAGFSDWRLPNVVELISIVNFAARSPSISEPPFINTGDVFYWSSTTVSGETTLGWRVRFLDGNISPTEAKTEVHPIRCVRLGI